MTFSTADEVIKYIADSEVEYVDIRFSDLPGVQQHFSIPAKAFTADLAEEGLAFDGSSVRGFQSIDESDMLLLPDFSTAPLPALSSCQDPMPPLDPDGSRMTTLETVVAEPHLIEMSPVEPEGDQ